MNAPVMAFDLLVVEDDELDVHALKRALKQIGFGGTVAVADSVAHARQHLQNEHRPGVILLDLNMPQESGLELLAELHASDAVRPPVVVLTSSDDPSDRDECYRHGAAGYFVKPTNMKNLQETARSILDYWARSQRPSS